MDRGAFKVRLNAMSQAIEVYCPVPCSIIDDVLYSQKFWRKEYLADCSSNGIWRILLWRLGEPYTIIIFIAKW